MGAVYLAEHPEIGRRVAVKVLRPEMIKDVQLLGRFLNEARAANAIRHPHIIEILDSGTTPEGTPYLVMELLEGESLAARVRRLGKLSIKESLEFAFQTASALAAAHAKGIIHRDLKPDNLFVIRDPNDASRERIKVLDFGIAKLQTLPSGEGMQTRTGTLMGTPVYMSPEQCLGTKTVDARSDIYALGIIMFEMMAGRPPFVSDGFGELVNMHLNFTPMSLRELNPEVTPAIEAVIMKALKKNPDDRQRSALELQSEIRGLSGGTLILKGVSSPDLGAATLIAPTAGAARTVDFAMSATNTLTPTAAGERMATTANVRRSRWSLIFGGATAVVVVAVGSVLFLSTAGRDAPTPSIDKRRTEFLGEATGVRPKLPQAERNVKISLDSQPPGATVRIPESGAVLGVTPFSLERPAQTPALTVRFEKENFLPVTRVLTFDSNQSQVVALAPAGPDPVEPRPEPTKKRPRRNGPSTNEPAKL